MLIRLLGILAYCAVASTASIAQDARRAQREDLAYARENYVTRSPSLTPSARRQALAYIKEIESRPGAMSSAEFAIAVMRIAAFSGNAHDSVEFGDGWTPSFHTPFRMLWFPDGLVIARASTDLSDLLGAKIIRLEGLTPRQLMSRLRPLRGGLDEFRQWDVLWAFHFGDLLKAAGIAKSEEFLHLELELPNGSNVVRTIKMARVDDVPPNLRPDRTWSPELSDREAELGWRTAVDGIAAPLFEQEARRRYRLVELPDLSAWYLQFRSNMDYQDQHIDSFVSGVRSRLETAPPQNIIVDFRFDTGGDSTKTRQLMRDIAKHVAGRIYLLTDRLTFSAGIV